MPPLLYWYGPQIRAASAFALEIQKAEADAKHQEHRAQLIFDREQTVRGEEGFDGARTAADVESQAA